MSAQRHILITGGTRGLGLAFVKASVDAGYAVTTCARETTVELDDLIASHPNKARFIACDLSAPNAAENLISEAETHAPLYAVVNNAAAARDGVLATLPEIEVNRMLSVNLEAPLLICRAVLRRMLRRSDGGRLINVSSIVASTGFSGLATYAATKGGLEAMTRALAREVGRRDITVNAIAPGYMETDLSAGLNTQQLDAIRRRTPAGRLVTVDDVTPSLLFLLSEGARFINGHVLTIDGGLTA